MGLALKTSRNWVQGRGVTEVYVRLGDEDFVGNVLRLPLTTSSNYAGFLESIKQDGVRCTLYAVVRTPSTSMTAILARIPKMPAANARSVNKWMTLSSD
jgi:hypothetical protein